MIARFVDDLLECIRTASLANLRAALSPDVGLPRPRQPRRRRAGPLASERPASIPTRQMRDVHGEPSRRFGDRPGSSPAASRSSADIMNPEGLLAMTPAAPSSALGSLSRHRQPDLEIVGAGLHRHVARKPGPDGRVRPNHRRAFAVLRSLPCSSSFASRWPGVPRPVVAVLGHIEAHLPGVVPHFAANLVLRIEPIDR
jgi:hypothetical protein